MSKLYRYDSYEVKLFEVGDGVRKFGAMLKFECIETGEIAHCFFNAHETKEGFGAKKGSNFIKMMKRFGVFRESDKLSRAQRMCSRMRGKMIEAKLRDDKKDRLISSSIVMANLKHESCTANAHLPHRSRTFNALNSRTKQTHNKIPESLMGKEVEQSSSTYGRSACGKTTDKRSKLIDKGLSNAKVKYSNRCSTIKDQEPVSESYISQQECDYLEELFSTRSKQVNNSERTPYEVANQINNQTNEEWLSEFSNN